MDGKSLDSQQREAIVVDEDAVKVIQSSNDSVSIKVLRGDQEISFIIPFENQSKKVLGITFKREYQKHGFFESTIKSFNDTVSYIKAVFMGMVKNN